MRYLDFICTEDTLQGGTDPQAAEFDAFGQYEKIVEFYDSCPECASFPKEEYFAGDWYANWIDYVIWEDGRIAARAGIWKYSEEQWEVAGVITRPEYRGRGYSARLVAHCATKILQAGKRAYLTTAETNTPMIAAAKKAGFVEK